MVLTLVVSGMLAAKRSFQGQVGPAETALVMLAGVSVLASGIPARARWPWYLGLVVCLLGVWHLFPRPPRVTGMAAGLVAGVYILAGLPVVWSKSREGRTWPWMQGAFGCFLAAALITSTDLVGMLLVAVPLCLCYLAVAISGHRRRSSLCTLGPALVVGGSLVAIYGGYLTTEFWTYALLRIGVAVAVLGVIAAVAGASRQTDSITDLEVPDTGR